MPTKLDEKIAEAKTYVEFNEIVTALRFGGDLLDLESEDIEEDTKEGVSQILDRVINLDIFSGQLDPLKDKVDLLRSLDLLAFRQPENIRQQDVDRIKS
jgi:hypothetical protein